ncbi:MAG: hypothetical protein AAFX01_12025 [Cyanobacteria bacterium J06638_28]
MTLSLPVTGWILALAIGYLVIVYSLLWWAKRNDGASKRSIF